MITFGLIGKSLGHSFSKGYFDNQFYEFNLSEKYRYLNFELPEISELRNLVSQNPDILGLNITIPFKEQVLHFLDEIDADANAIGAVNTVKVIRDPISGTFRLKGCNTDFLGFSESIKPFLQSHHLGALVLGTGGASKAVQYALKKMGIKVKVVGREGISLSDLKYDQVNAELLNSHPIIVNTTPLGTWPDIKQKPNLPYQSLSRNNLLFDLVYNPEITEFLNQGKLYGCSITNGYDMLKNQALLSFRFWTGLELSENE